MAAGHYNRNQFARALRAVGLRKGDIVFSHSNIGFFGLPEEGRSADTIFETILGAFQDVIGTEGTLVVPTFTYSFCKQQPFDPGQTPSTCGVFTEMLRRRAGALRSLDPIFSVAALGRQAKDLTLSVSEECFGPDSFWDRFQKADGKICNLNFDAGSTFIHYAERSFHVPYRYDKLFTGMFVEHGKSRKGAAIFFCRDGSNPGTESRFEPFDRLARKKGIVQSAPVGKGAIVCLRARDAYQLIKRHLKGNPWFLTEAGVNGQPPVLMPPPAESVHIPPSASIGQLLHGLWKLPRDIVSDGYDSALLALSRQVPMTIHEYPTGTRCWTWIVPEKWTCHEAYLETLDGRRLFSYADHPLHVVSYSLPFDGEVSREELLKHLHTHPKHRDAIPYVFKYYDRDWGLCCSQRLRDSLQDERYRVRINTSFSYSTLKIGEVIVPGETDETIVLCAHLCHPHMVNDDLTGVLVGIDVMRDLLKRPKGRYTYRFLIVPETIGSLAYLSHHEGLIPKMRGGLFLEMLGLPNPHALQLSFAGTTGMDHCLTLALREYDPKSWTGPYISVIGNDERQFNAPGVRVPMLSLSRVLPPSSPDWPYPEYHSSLDNPECASLSQMEDSRNAVLRMIEAIERNRVPKAMFKGEIFLSRFGLHIDGFPDREAYDAMFRVMHHLDGKRSLAQIAAALGLSWRAAQGAVNALAGRNLVVFCDKPAASRNGVRKRSAKTIPRRRMKVRD